MANRKVIFGGPGDTLARKEGEEGVPVGAEIELPEASIGALEAQGFLFFPPGAEGRRAAAAQAPARGVGDGRGVRREPEGPAE